MEKIACVNESEVRAAPGHASREWVAELDHQRAHESRFINGYMTLNECSESAARAVYIHEFPVWPGMNAS